MISVGIIGLVLTGLIVRFAHHDASAVMLYDGSAFRRGKCWIKVPPSITNTFQIWVCVMSFHTNLMILNIIALFKHSISICYLRLTLYGICVNRIFVLHILCNNDTPSINRRVRNAAWHNGVTENDIRCVCFCFILPPNRCPGCKAWVDKIRVLEAWEIYPCCHVAGLTKIYDVTTQRHGKSNTEKKSVQCIFCGKWAWHFVRTFTLKFHTEFSPLHRRKICIWMLCWTFDESWYSTGMAY